MATQTQPALTSNTKPNNAGGVTTVATVAPRKVTYVFQCITAETVSLPYAVTVNGAVLPAFAKRALRVPSGAKRNAQTKKITSKMPGQFTVAVQSGDRVALYLNSDAALGFRTTPVYAVTVGANDVIVRITEKEGLHSDSDTPVQSPAPSQAAAAASVDEYEAPLTGNIWMKVSHKYTEAEVDARLPAGTSAVVAQAVKSIYKGLGDATLVVTEPGAAGQPARTLKVELVDSNNPRENIVGYNLLSDGLTRAHPGGFAALINAGLAAGVSKLTVSSCWRPMVGSIAHRAGLGLDVSMVGVTRLNRQELGNAFKKGGKGHGNGKDDDLVTEAEVTAFGELEKAMVAKKDADAELVSARKALTAAKRSGNAAAVKPAEERAKEAKDAADKAAEAQREKRDAWDAARDANEPNVMHQYRAALLQCSCVRQLFDPWFMYTDTKQPSGAEPNMQKTGNEQLHAHHLHITVDDQKSYELHSANIAGLDRHLVRSSGHIHNGDDCESANIGNSGKPQ